ncbi:hypothetical protein ACEWY4_022679 [Coilia grayii]|uniref:Zinc-binding protein A33-like n=1 Tax=Coilia grayii TaxID=363190 RepID=A0ABD1J3Y7_9TELE
MATSLEEDLTCPVCTDIFKDPVVLSCSHSVCKVCVQQFWERKGSRECPVCKRRSSKDCPTQSFVLKTLCETFIKKRGQTHVLCNVHKKQLALFCQDDKELVCQLCRDSKVHKDHKFSPVGKAATEVKVGSFYELMALKYNIWDSNSLVSIIQSKHTERQIKKVFFELHQFLQDEEAARIAALREEEEQKSQMMKEKIEKMRGEISSLSNTIRAIKEEMETDDVTFLQVNTLFLFIIFLITQCTLQDPERLSGALINVAKHLGNLKFRVWEKMQETVQYTPVTLDPNTAHPLLFLSEDLTSLRNSGVWQQLPDNPERFDYKYASVLGSEGFNSGTHCWDVEVGDDTGWTLGVVTESFQRKGDYTLVNGVWYVWYNDGKYRACSTPQPETVLTVKQKFQRIRVQLDWDRGELSFSDPDNNTHIHTLTHTFTERVFPYFDPGLRFPLRILPVKTSVRVEQHRAHTTSFCQLNFDL